MKQAERIKLAAAHIEEHLAAFHNHTGGDRSAEEYLSDYWNKYEEPGTIYTYLCNDLGIEPRNI